MSNPIQDQEIEAFILEAFEQNFAELRMDAGHAITPDVKRTALLQVQLYWRMLRDVAENVTDTEVRLSLPGQETPTGSNYSIEGVVDIVRENDRVIMYDIKTHNAEFVRANLETYEQQLNVYAYIWQELRQQRLDEMAIIATDFPEAVRNALEKGDPDELAYALSQWQPLVKIKIDRWRVDQTVQAFGKVVDEIEAGHFGPPTVNRLNEPMPGTRNIRFGTHVCRNCDARFSCSAYRQYAWSGGRNAAERSAMKYFIEASSDPEEEAWRSANLDAALEARDLRADFGGR